MGVGLSGRGLKWGASVAALCGARASLQQAAFMVKDQILVLKYFPTCFFSALKRTPADRGHKVSADANAKR